MSEEQEPPCACTGAGWCDRYQIQQNAFTHGRCQGSNCTPEKANAFRRKWRLQLAGELAKPVVLDTPVERTARQIAPCIYEGSITQTATCNCENKHVRLCTHPSADIDTCTRGPNNGTIASCLTCAERRTTEAGYTLETMALVVDHGGGGLGDWLQGRCVMEWLRLAHPERPLVYNAGQKKRLNAQAFGELFVNDGLTFGDCAVPHSDAPVRGALQMNAGYHAEDLSLARRAESSLWRSPRWERYQRNVGAKGFTLPTLREPERLRAMGSDGAGAIALLPFSTEAARCWSVQHWLTLEGLLRQAGYRTLVFHHETKSIERFQGIKVAGQAPERVVGALLNCAVAVGSDHGLAHLAGVLRRPVIVLGGYFPVQQIYGCYPGFYGLQGELACASCCNGGPAFQPNNHACRPACANLNSITPQRVFDAIDELVLPQQAGGQSLLDWRRLRRLRDLVRATNHLPGELAEVGVYKGGSAKLIDHYTDYGDGGTTLHLFDTFTGIPSDDSNGAHRRGDFADTAVDAVRALLSSPLVEFHVGEFPATAPSEVRYRFVHLDGDTYQTTKAALAYFVPRLVAGGVMVFDDFQWPRTPGVTQALYETFSPERIEHSAGSYQAWVHF